MDSFSRSEDQDLDTNSIYLRIIRRATQTWRARAARQAICVSAAAISREGVSDFHGYELAKRLSHDADRHLLTAYGTLYRALARLEQMGMLTSRREDPEISARENRPGRRLYALTPAGEAAAREHGAASHEKLSRRARRREAPA